MQLHLLRDPLLQVRRKLGQRLAVEPGSEIGLEREGKRGERRESETDRGTERERQTKTQAQTDRHTERQRQTDSDRQTDREGGGGGERERGKVR